MGIKVVNISVTNGSGKIWAVPQFWALANFNTLW